MGEEGRSEEEGKEGKKEKEEEAGREVGRGGEGKEEQGNRLLCNSLWDLAVLLYNTTVFAGF